MKIINSSIEWFKNIYMWIKPKEYRGIELIEYLQQSEKFLDPHAANNYSKEIAIVFPNNKQMNIQQYTAHLKAMNYMLAMGTPKKSFVVKEPIKIRLSDFFTDSDDNIIDDYVSNWYLLLIEAYGLALIYENGKDSIDTDTYAKAMVTKQFVINIYSVLYNLTYGDK